MIRVHDGISNSAYAYLWKKLNYHPVQSALWHCTNRFVVVVAGRRSGKTVLSRRKIVLQLPRKKPWYNPIYYYILPTFNQAKKTAWYDIIKMIPRNWLFKKISDSINKTELSITTVWGSKLYISGADKPERLEGTACDFAVIDESSDQRPGLYQKTIIPMLSERGGTCWRIGVPKRTGIGRVEFREAFNRGIRGEDGIASFHWKSADILPMEEIEIARTQMDEQDYLEQFEAQWRDIGSSVYYNFSEVNVRGDIYYDPSKEIVVGCDFNVDPMCWTLGHFYDGKLYIFDEVFIRDANTPRTMDFLNVKYHQHTGGWKFYGDASSRSRKTSATKSDYAIIKNDARFGERKAFFPHRNPNPRDRYASINGGFKNAKGDTRIYIASSCKHLINDLNTISWQEGKTVIEDYTGTDIGHMSDAFGYKVYSLMPVRVESTSVPQIWSRTA